MLGNGWKGHGRDGVGAGRARVTCVSAAVDGSVACGSTWLPGATDTSAPTADDDGAASAPEVGADPEGFGRGPAPRSESFMGNIRLRGVSYDFGEFYFTDGHCTSTLG